MVVTRHIRSRVNDVCGSMLVMDDIFFCICEIFVCANCLMYSFCPTGAPANLSPSLITSTCGGSDPGCGSRVSVCMSILHLERFNDSPIPEPRESISRRISLTSCQSWDVGTFIVGMARLKSSVSAFAITPIFDITTVSYRDCTVRSKPNDPSVQPILAPCLLQITSTQSSSE
jgi:hypothetical protein